MSPSSASTAAVRSGVSGDRAAERTGTESSAAAAATDCATDGAGGLDTSSTRSVRRVGVQGGERVERRQPADGLRQVAPADAEDVRDADAGHVEQAGDLLRAGAGGGDQPDRPRTDDVGEAERDAGDDRRPAVGAHDQHARRRAAARLSATSCSTGTPSEKTSTLRPAAIASAASATAYWPGTETIARAAASGASSASPAPIVRCGMAAAVPVERSRAARAASTAATAAASAVVVLGPDGDEQLLGRGVLVGRQAHAGRELEVQRRGHGDQDGGDAVQAATISRLTCMSRTESA